MSQNDYLIRLKKSIRKIVKSREGKDLKEHIYVIKCTLVFISKIILLKIESYDESTEDILKVLEEKSSIKFKVMTTDIEQLQSKYIYDDILCTEVKIELINIINKIEKDELMKFSLGELYDYFTTGNEKKYLGQVYTPKDIVKAMIDSNLSARDIIENPYFKVIDIACGGGYFLLEAYDKIKKIIVENYDKIIAYDSKIKEKLENGVHDFILKNNIWATDIDNFAVYMTRFSLSIRGETEFVNVFNSDVLLSEEPYLKENKFDLVISNPPYIGHKKIDKNYRLSLSKLYSEVYSDKGDISYCFFKKGYDLLAENGKLSFITSRYFIESQSGRGIRNFIREKFSINRIIDFYGENIFKGVGISPLIIDCTRSNTNSKDIKVYKRKTNKKYMNFNENIKDNFIEFDVKQEDLKDSGWILLSLEEQKLFHKINTLGEINLKELSVFNQGIITGCDKAFIIDHSQLKQYPFEKNLIKPWIKNSDIDSFYLKDIKKYIIYTDNIEDEENYLNTIEWIKKYKTRLKNRRECKNGIRKWYELQWGRDEELFKDEKIVFPYKSSTNKFTISKDEICASADVYFIKLKKDLKYDMSLEYLVAFLNSKVCEYYFKCIAKKLNDHLYEYYPNKLVDLNIKLTDDISYIEQLVKEIEVSQNEKNYSKVIKLKLQIDKFFYELYNLTQKEINTIENYY